jgi:hypothetical protein
MLRLDGANECGTAPPPSGDTVILVVLVVVELEGMAIFDSCIRN